MADRDVRVLHGLVVKKAGTAESVAALLEWDVTEVEELLAAEVTAGRAIGAKGTYMVTPAGRSWLDEQYPRTFGDYRSDPEVAEAAQRFERINKELLALLTDWQSMSTGGRRVANDHSDADYDRAILDRLGDVQDSAVKVLDKLARPEPRLAVYGQRLEAAYDKVLAGETDYVSGVRVDSYHMVWHELHEDLLRVLGRTRQE